MNQQNDAAPSEGTHEQWMFNVANKIVWHIRESLQSNADSLALRHHKIVGEVSDLIAAAAAPPAAATTPADHRVGDRRQGERRLDTVIHRKGRELRRVASDRRTGKDRRGGR